MTTAVRRWRNIAFMTAGAVVIVVGTAVTSAALGEASFLTGWLLVGTMLALTLLNGRKKLPFLALGPVAAWLRFHVYMGWLSVVLFLVHVDMGLPDGPLEVALAVLYAVVAVSGIVGLLISRSFTKRLTRRGEEVIFERVPAYRRQVQQEAEDLVLQSVSEAESTAVSDFYVSRLKDFFDGPRNFLQHLVESNRARFTLITNIRSIAQHLDGKERESLERLSDLVCQKDDLDYHHALQATLKGWLFVHIPLTYSLWILVVLHLVLAYAFTGGMS